MMSFPLNVMKHIEENGQDEKIRLTLLGNDLMLLFFKSGTDTRTIRSGRINVISLESGG